MISFEQYGNDLLIHGHAYFYREEALVALDLKPEALAAAITSIVLKVPASLSSAFTKLAPRFWDDGRMTASPIWNCARRAPLTISLRCYQYAKFLTNIELACAQGREPGQALY